ncbi:hypothetical protein JZ751_005637 [Albula glossodonta]|uniref:Uncharacterized protein n=1 Tax=Albula glossodonta TaxID=121402 RepID=A0A8T2N592_9TELE|nr:hypothetical protein JZ751_005637 [Albula glossodonta]
MRERDSNYAGELRAERYTRGFDADSVERADREARPSPAAAVIAGDSRTQFELIAGSVRGAAASLPYKLIKRRKEPIPSGCIDCDRDCGCDFLRSSLGPGGLSF